MIHAPLNYLLAKQRADELTRAAERERFARSIHADRRRPAATRALARLRTAVNGPHSLAPSGSI